jgi:CRP/FNR family transcriptional regulator
VQPIPVNFFQLRSACSTCSLHELCLPAGLDTKELTRLDVVVSGKRSLKRRPILVSCGISVASDLCGTQRIYAKLRTHDDGREQVTGFHMLGELLGMDSIGSAKHTCDAIALEDTDISRYRLMILSA